LCADCRHPIADSLRADAIYCSRLCQDRAVQRRRRLRHSSTAYLTRKRDNLRRARRIRTYGFDPGENLIALSKDRYRHARAAGYRSGLEVALGRQLEKAGIAAEYETLTIPWIPKPKTRRYKPDWVLLSNGIIIESKGRFITADRSKHKEVKEQHPDLDIRFVFSNSKTRISKQSKTTYAMWCVTQGFQYADKEIPAAWLREPPNEKSLAAIQRLKEAE
jgi:hypothetical protein